MRVNARFVLTVEDLRPEEAPAHGFRFNAGAGGDGNTKWQAQEKCRIARVAQDVELGVTGRFKHSLSYLRCVARSIGLRLQSRDLVTARAAYAVSATVTGSRKQFDLGSQSQGAGIQNSLNSLFGSAEAVTRLGEVPFVKVQRKTDERGRGMMEIKGSVLVFVKVHEAAMTSVELAEVLRSVREGHL